MQANSLVESSSNLKANKLFICKSDPTKSFYVELSEEEIQTISVKQLIERACGQFSSQNKYFQILNVHTEIEDKNKINADHLLMDSHFNFLPIYFSTMQVKFQINVQFNGNNLSFQLPIHSNQEKLLQLVSKQINIPQDQLFLVYDSQVLKKQLQHYSSVDLLIAKNKIFFDEKEIYVDFGQTIETSCTLFKFALKTEIYKGDLKIAKNQTFFQAGIVEGDKLHSYYMKQVQIKDIKTVIKSTYTIEEAKQLYDNYFPNEKGRLQVEEKDQTLYFSLKNDWELGLVLKALNGQSYEINANLADTVDQLKDRICETHGIIPGGLKLIYQGKQIEGQNTLESFNIKDQSLLHLLCNPNQFFNQNKPLKNDQKIDEKTLQKDITITVKTLSGKQITTDCKPKDSVLVLKHQIQKILENFPVEEQRLIFEGKQLENDKKLIEYNINDSCTIHLITSLYSKKQNTQSRVMKMNSDNQEINIQVRYLTGKTTQVKCQTFDNAEVLKFIIEEIEGIPIQQQKFSFEGQQLEDGKQLYQYGIEEGSVVHLMLQLRGGGSEEQSKLFVDIENEDSKAQREFSDYAPDYRAASEGLNVEGKCSNKDCEYFDKQVICPIGYHAIEIIHDEDKQIVCPGCFEEIKIITCGFVNCTYSWCGIKLENGRERIVQSKILEADPNKYTTYDPINKDGSSNMVLWKQLFLYAKQRDYIQYPKCGICLRKIYRQENIKTNEMCLDKENHKFHPECLEKLKLFNDKCLICTSNY